MKKQWTICIISCLACWGFEVVAGAVPNQHVKEVIIVCKTHFDIGYTHRVSEVVNYYRTSMIDKAMKVMDESNDLPPEQRFSWTLPGWVLHKTMEDWDGQTLARKQTLDDRFRSGKILVHALPFTFESDACEPEMMARSLSFSSALARRYGLPLPRSGKQTDVPSHSGALATVLANAGVKFVHIGCNWPSAPLKTPGLFWWEGPDGSRVLTMYSTMYGTFYDSHSSWRSSDDIMMGQNFLPPAEWPYQTWPAILVTGDNAGAPSAKTIKAKIAELRAQLPGVNVRMGTMDDFYDAIMREHPNIPTLKAEMPDSWIHGVMCDPNGMRLSRAVNPLVASAEILNTQLRAWGVPVAPAQKTISDIYEYIALYGEHTWGKAPSVNIYGEAFRKLPANRFADLEASWEDKTDYIRKATDMAHRLVDADLDALAASVKGSGEHRWLVYNPLPWKRSGMIQINGIDCFIKDIPASGYRVVTLDNLPQRKNMSGTVLENAYHRITIDPAKGCITSWVDKQTGTEWIDASKPQGMGHYLNERFTLEQTIAYVKDYQHNRTENYHNHWLHPGMHKPGMISEKRVPYQAVTSGNGRLHITETDTAQIAKLTMPGNAVRHLAPTSLKLVLYRDTPYVDLELTILNKAKDNWPEADWLCLPFRIRDPEFKVYRSLGKMNPKTDILKGANRHMYTVGTGVIISGMDGKGVAICPLDHPLISLGEPGCWKFSNDYVPKDATVYVNLYNNQWNTNFRYWYPGTWSSRVRLWMVDQECNDASFAKQALEARNPLLTRPIMATTTGTLPDHQTGIEVSRPGVLITAFAPDTNGNEGILLRAWEQAGVSGALSIQLPKGITVSQAIPVDLRGEKIGDPIPINNGKMLLDLKAYAPLSVILK